MIQAVHAGFKGANHPCLGQPPQIILDQTRGGYETNDFTGICEGNRDIFDLF